MLPRVITGITEASPHEAVTIGDDYDAYEAALAKRPLSRRFAEDKAFTYPAFVRRYSFDLGPEATYLYSPVVGSSP